MAKQIQIVANREDEKALLEFVRSTADIQLFETLAPSIDDLWVQELHPDSMLHHQYLIWNKAFSWNPQYGRVFPEVPETGGWFFPSEFTSAPVIELGRCDAARPGPGRLCWHTGSTGIYGEYDVIRFAKWYNAIVSWVRKHGKKLHDEAYHPYYLPGAWAEKMEANRPNQAP